MIFSTCGRRGNCRYKGVLLVTHNIEEAVLMCDRLLLFCAQPGRIVSEIPIDLPKPRHSIDPRFRAIIDRVYVEMTTRPGTDARAGARVERYAAAGIGTMLPHVSSNLLAGLLEAVSTAPYNGHADLPAISADLRMEADELFPVAEALQMLRFAELAGGDIRLTETGDQFAKGETDERKRLFSLHLLSYIPLAAHIRRVLDERASHTAPKSRFLDELEDHMAEDAAEETLRTVISWGRYAEAFAYDDQSQSFSLENPT